MAKKLSNIGYALPVEQISRKFARRKDTCSVKKTGGPDYIIPAARYMGASVRDCQVFGVEGRVNKNIFYVRTAPYKPTVTQEMNENRSYFAQACAWANAAQKDLTAITSNQQTFATCLEDFSNTVAGVSVRGYQTMTGWMKAVAFSILKSGGELPVDHKLPQID